MTVQREDTLATMVELTAPTGAVGGKGVPLIGRQAAANSLPVVLAQEMAATSVSVTPTITATAYNATTKNSVGGKQTLAGAVLASGGIAILQSVLVLDKANQKAPLTILLFDADPTVGTYTDNGQVNLSTDISKVIRRINVTAGDYETIDNSGTDYAIAEIGPISKLVKAASGTSLYAVILTTGAPTYTSTADLTVRFGFLQ